MLLAGKKEHEPKVHNFWPKLWKCKGYAMHIFLSPGWNSSDMVGFGSKEAVFSFSAPPSCFWIEKKRYLFGWEYSQAFCLGLWDFDFHWCSKRVEVVLQYCHFGWSCRTKKTGTDTIQLFVPLLLVRWSTSSFQGVGVVHGFVFLPGVLLVVLLGPSDLRVCWLCVPKEAWCFVVACVE